MPFTGSPEKCAHLLRRLFEEASLGIAVEDLEGKLLLANPALCSILGFRQEELRAMSCSDFASPEDSEDDWAHFQKLRAGLIDRYSIEKRYVRKDGALIWGRLTVSLVNNSDGEAAPLVFAFVEEITKHKLAEEALTKVSSKLIEAQEEERTRIGRDLHDDIGQRLALLAGELQRMKESLPDSPAQLGEGIDNLREQTLEISRGVQTLSHKLHSSKLEYLGVLGAMKGFCREFGEQQRMEVGFKSRDVPSSLPFPVSLSLFRVLQEALHNASKHSGVHHFEVELWGTPGQIHLTVSDFGAGFDPEQAKESRGLGLTSMQERMRLVNGELAIESQINRGTTIHAHVPLSSHKNSRGKVG
jgi:PAS domain S-box-containing protein